MREEIARPGTAVRPDPESWTGAPQGGSVSRVFFSAITMRLFSAVAAFALTMLLGRLLGADGYGAYAFAMGWLSLAILATSLGFQHYAVRAIPPMLVAGRPPAVIGFILASAALTGCLALAATLAAPTLVSMLVFSPDPRLEAALVVAAVLLVPTTLNQLRSGILRGLGQPVAGQLPELVLQPTLLLGLVGAAWLVGTGLDAVTALRLAFVAAIASLALGLLPLVRALRTLGWARPVFQGRPWMVGAVKSSFLFAAGTVMAATDTVMLGQLSSAAETGLYGVAARFFQLMYLPALAASAALAHEASRLHAAGRMLELSALARTTATRTALLALVFAGGCTLVAFHLGAIFGPDFAAAKGAVLILVWARAAEAVFGHPGAILANTAFAGLTAVLFAAAACGNIALNALLIPSFGAEGAAVATGLSHFLLTAAVFAATYLKLGVLSLPDGSRPWSTSEQ